MTSTLESRRAFVARASTLALATALSALGCNRPEAAAPVDSRPRDPGSSGAGRATAALDPTTASVLLALVQQVFPHPGIAADLFRVSVDALAAAAGQAPAVATMLTTGVQDLLKAAGGDFAGIAPERQTQLLAAIEATPFFQTVRATTVFTFYNQPKVWEAFGYEGDAWAKGGYLARGLADIDWLPNPSAAVASQP